MMQNVTFAGRTTTNPYRSKEFKNQYKDLPERQRNFINFLLLPPPEREAEQTKKLIPVIKQ
jgi:hypothetical protein